MSRVQECHSIAMDLAEAAFVAKLNGNLEQADSLFRQAFLKEREAAQLVQDHLAEEPSRSILHRSAASLAIDCGELREAERLIAFALTGNPPTEIAEELRDLLEQVNFHRHLDLIGVALESDELQMSIAGKSVGYGITVGEELTRRLQSIEKIIYRTVERLSKIPFRSKAKPEKAISDKFRLFVSIPRPASFAISIKIGGPKTQLFIPQSSAFPKIIDEVMTCFDIFNSMTEDSLRVRISDEDYYHNFIGLARQISPDGDRVNLVGFTAIQGNIERKVALTKPRGELSVKSEVLSTDDSYEHITVVGNLLFADSTKEGKNIIKLVEATGIKHIIKVPDGMMADIVKPLWEDTVIVKGIRKRKVIELKDITKVD